MVDRIIYGPALDMELRNVAEVPCKTGWSPLPEGYKSLRAMFPENESLAIDKTAWDWTMPGWVVRSYIRVRLAQCRNPDRRYARLVWARACQVVGPEAVFRLPSGQRYRQREWGLMKSGWLQTLSMNSMAQDLQSDLAWQRSGLEGSPPPVWAMGDDKLMKWNPTEDQLERFVLALATTGCVVKHALRSREFAGFLFEGDQVKPLYPKKHSFTVRYVSPDNEQAVLLAFAMLYSLQKDESWFDQVKHHLDFPIANILPMWAAGLINVADAIRLNHFKP